ncbi:MAG: hypothetical protein ACLFPB_04175 [Desulfovermiculus sp.]
MSNASLSTFLENGFCKTACGFAGGKADHEQAQASSASFTHKMRPFDIKLKKQTENISYILG